MYSNWLEQTSEKGSSVYKYEADTNHKLTSNNLIQWATVIHFYFPMFNIHNMKLTLGNCAYILYNFLHVLLYDFTATAVLYSFNG